MESFIDFLARFAQDDSGAPAIEYALLAALVALGLTAGMSSLATGISSFFTKIGTELSGAAVPNVP